MLRPRIIPVLLIEGRRLVKTRRFTQPRYVGDPVNAVRIFNTKEVDELLLLDIRAATTGRPDFDLVREIASEAFMPVAYGGGVRTLDDMARLFDLGVEKISLGRAALNTPDLLTRAAERYGRQSVVACIDHRTRLLGGPNVVTNRGQRSTGLNPVDFARACVSAGAGELLVQSVDRDGMRKGFDLPLLRAIAAAVDVPVVACGGADNLTDLRAVIHESKVSAAAAGSMFVFQGKLQAVLIAYPSPRELQKIIAEVSGS
jgi:imidazole glycerol-phosphate synthase subunit HisF